MVGGARVFFPVWLSSNTTTSVNVQLQPTLKQVGDFPLGSVPVSLNETVQQYNVTYTMLATGMQLYQSAFPASVNFTFQTSTPRVAVTLHWGSLNRMSRVAIPFTNYASIQSVKITDYRGAENQTFNVQPPPNQNILFLTANVRRILDTGPDGGVPLANLTISGAQG